MYLPHKTCASEQISQFGSCTPRTAAGHHAPKGLGAHMEAHLHPLKQDLTWDDLEPAAAAK